MGMWHVWEIGEVYMGLEGRDLMEREYLEDLGVDKVKVSRNKPRWPKGPDFLDVSALQGS